jgi:glutamine phosphoribosylpyrophosphate amidotransferase
MCGVIGYKPINQTASQQEVARIAFGRLMHESKVRGMHSYGLVDYWPSGSLERYIRFTAEENRPLESTILCFRPELMTIAHCRFSTSGDWRGNNWNAQPLVIEWGKGHGDLALTFNGVIHMGTKEEFEEDWEVKCETDNDGEIFLRRLEKGDTPEGFFKQLAGSFAGVWLKDKDLWAGRNARRPLWKCIQYGALWYASTQDIFKRAGFEGMTEVPVGVEVNGARSS